MHMNFVGIREGKKSLERHRRWTNAGGDICLKALVSENVFWRQLE